MAKGVPAVTARKVRKLLCLHGYTQNATVFRKRTAVFRKDISTHYELEFVTAPHQANVPARTDATNVLSMLSKTLNDGSRNGSSEDTDEQRAWWVASDCGTVYQGLDESLKMLEQVWHSRGPFDGILGFSQGATMAWLLAGYLHRTYRVKLQAEPLSNTDAGAFNTSLDDQSKSASAIPLMVVAVSGFVPKSDHGLALIKDAGEAKIRGLHIIGRSDTWVDPIRSEQLAMMLKSISSSCTSTLLESPLALKTNSQESPNDHQMMMNESNPASPTTTCESNGIDGPIQSILYHDGGHFVPTDAAMRCKIKEWLFTTVST
ncbi:dihydrofolate reductase [Batrachochytrium dendrobatidis]